MNSRINGGPHQLIGGRVAGSNMMSESLAEYSALRVAEKKYGDDQMHKFLSHELDGYLRGRLRRTAQRAAPRSRADMSLTSGTRRVR